LKQQKKTFWAIILMAVAGVAWASVIVATLAPLPAAATTGCTPCTVNAKEPNLGAPNCAKIGSCGVPGCRRIAGGSQYMYSNGIPACLREKDPNCHDLQCHVKAYGSTDCSGDELDDSWIDRRGCKKPTTIPPSNP
jgi:hypothetical protein